MVINKATVAIGVALVGAASAAGLCIANQVKFRKDIKKMEKSMADNIDVNIPESMVDEAVKIAVDRATSIYAGRAVNEMVSKLKSDIEREANSAVKKQFNVVKDSVKSTLESKIGDIDISEIRDEIVEEAKETVADKFKKDLDGILDDYKDNLRNVSKIYQSIADSMGTKKESSGIRITTD